MCSLHLTHPSAHTPGAVGSRHSGARGAVGVRSLAQGSHLSRAQFLPEPRFEPTTSDYKSNALSTRPRLPKLYFIPLIYRVLLPSVTPITQAYSSLGLQCPIGVRVNSTRGIASS